MKIRLYRCPLPATISANQCRANQARAKKAAKAERGTPERIDGIGLEKCVDCRGLPRVGTLVEIDIPERGESKNTRERGGLARRIEVQQKAKRLGREVYMPESSPTPEPDGLVSREIAALVGRKSSKNIPTLLRNAGIEPIGVRQEGKRPAVNVYRREDVEPWVRRQNARKVPRAVAAPAAPEHPAATAPAADTPLVHRWPEVIEHLRAEIVKLQHARDAIDEKMEILDQAARLMGDASERDA